MKRDIVAEYYRPLLEQNRFRPVPCPDKFSPAGQCWDITPETGGGYYWVYAKQDLFDIKIHDFFFHEDQCLDMNIPPCISIQRYDSISGEELSPYRRLSAGDIQTIVGGKPRYRALIHKRIPIHAVGVEILPAYYEDFLKKQYPDIYFDLPAAFQSVDQATDFPAMSKLLLRSKITGETARRRHCSTRPRSPRPSPWWWTPGSARAAGPCAPSPPPTRKAFRMWSATSPTTMPLTSPWPGWPASPA